MNIEMNTMHISINALLLNKDQLNCSRHITTQKLKSVESSSVDFWMNYFLRMNPIRFFPACILIRKQLFQTSDHFMDIG
jgi:hypothetical protein